MCDVKCLKTIEIRCNENVYFDKYFKYDDCCRVTTKNDNNDLLLLGRKCDVITFKLNESIDDVDQYECDNDVLNDCLHPACFIFDFVEMNVNAGRNVVSINNGEHCKIYCKFCEEHHELND